VVTADHAEMTTIESLGAFGFSPGWLEAELKAAGLEVRDSLNQYRRKKLT